MNYEEAGKLRLKMRRLGITKTEIALRLDCNPIAVAEALNGKQADLLQDIKREVDDIEQEIIWMREAAMSLGLLDGADPEIMSREAYGWMLEETGVVF